MLGCERTAGLGRSLGRTSACCPRVLLENKSPRLPKQRIACLGPSNRKPRPHLASTANHISANSMHGQQHSRSAAAVPRFRPESQSDRDAADAGSDREASSKEAVTRRDHWATLLTTMPNLSSRGWSGRLGEFITHTGPTTDEDKVSATGSILHLWKANVAESETTGGEPSEVDLPESVAINYYTADGISVTKQSSVAAHTTAAEQDTAEQQQGVFLWDQEQLKAKPTKFVFSPDAPQLSLTLSGWQQQAPVLYRVLRLLPLSSSGVAIVNAALPDAFGDDVAAAQPPGSYWFFEVLLTHPDGAGDWQASTLGIAYDWATGELSSHRYSWQKVTEPVEAPPDDISTVKVKAVTPPQRNSSASLSDVMWKLSSQTQLQHTHTSYSYSYDEHQRLMRKTHTSAEAAQAPDAAGATDAFSIANFIEDAGHEQGKGLVTLWFPHGGAYARVPARLPGADNAAAATSGQVHFEIGAVHGDGSGLSKCVLVYESRSGGARRLLRVENDEWVAQLEL